MTKNLHVLSLKGKAIHPYLDDLARLGLRLFKEYPYLYDADPADKTCYGARYAECPESVMVVVLDRGNVVGASMGMPLHFDSDVFKNAFLDNGIPAEQVFYLSESLLLPEYRGKGFYRHFFKEREEAAKQYGCSMTAFSAVYRDPNHPKQLAGYVPLDNVWQHFGYTRHPEIYIYNEWKDVGEAKSSHKRLVFWLKTI